jgi:hypothetical protein
MDVLPPYILRQFIKLVHNITYHRGNEAVIRVKRGDTLVVDIERIHARPDLFYYSTNDCISDVAPVFQYIHALKNTRGAILVAKMELDESRPGPPTFVVDVDYSGDASIGYWDVEPGNWNGTGSLTDWFVDKMGGDRGMGVRSLPPVRFIFAFTNAILHGDPDFMVALAALAEVILGIVLLKLHQPSCSTSLADISACYKPLSHGMRSTVELAFSVENSQELRRHVFITNDELNKYTLGLTGLVEPTHDDALILSAVYEAARNYPSAPALTGNVISPNFRRPWPLGARLKLPLTDPPEYTMDRDDPNALDPQYSAAFLENAELGGIDPSRYDDVDTVSESAPAMKRRTMSSEYDVEAAMDSDRASTATSAKKKLRTMGGGRSRAARQSTRLKSPRAKGMRSKSPRLSRSGRARSIRSKGDRRRSSSRGVKLSRRRGEKL